MNRKPSEDIPKSIADQHPVYRAILDWFDEIWVEGVWPVIDEMYTLFSYKTVDDKFLDLFLYDKGFSTSASLTPDMKRCILDNWNEIYRKRHTPAGMKLYFSCMLENLEIDFIGNRINNFIQDNSTNFSFGNAEMLSTVNNPDGHNNPPNLMTYLYHPSYIKDIYLHFIYDHNTNTTRDLLDYIANLIPLEFPRIGLSERLNVNFYTQTGETATVSGTNVTLSGSPTYNFSSLSGFKYIGLLGKMFEINLLTSTTSLTLEIDTWVTARNYDKNDEVIGTDGKLYYANESHTSGANFLDDVTDGNWIVVDGTVNWQFPDPLYYT